MSNPIEVTLPDIGDFDQVDIIEVLVSPGDRIEAEDSIITLESDKATMEIPSPYTGTVKELKVKVGDKISQGGLIMILEPDESALSELDEYLGHVSSSARVVADRSARFRKTRPPPRRGRTPFLSGAPIESGDGEQESG